MIPWMKRRRHGSVMDDRGQVGHISGELWGLDGQGDLLYAQLD